MKAKNLSRRTFLNWAAVAGVTAASGAVLSNFPGVTPKTSAAGPTADLSSRPEWVMVIDLERCNGCQKCTQGCIDEHRVPPAWGEPNYEGSQEWIRVISTSKDPNASQFLPMPCMNCENAPCVKVCPTGATYYNDEGLVLIDNTRCIGCRFCIAACPYDRRYFNWGEPPHSPDEQIMKYTPDFPNNHKRGTTEKCNWCSHRVRMGRLPACVEACHKEGMNAIFFGDRKQDAITNGEETFVLSEIIARRGGYRLKEELGTQPSLYYLPPGGK